VIEDLETKDPFFPNPCFNHLKLIEAAAEDAANQRAGRVEAGTNVETVPGTIGTGTCCED
jgi:hypothetical protein